MKLSRYWPNNDEIRNCIRWEAETNSDAMLLAVHQPMHLEKKIIGNVTKTPEKIQENRFLEDFLKEKLNQGTLIMPVTGASGSGKSHLIGWLHAKLNQLKAQNDSRVEKFTIVRIPKSASLRRVVELILEPLKLDPKFDSIRNALNTATTAVTPDRAAIRFNSGIQIALGSLSRQLREELKQLSSSNPNSPEILTKSKGHL